MAFKGANIRRNPARGCRRIKSYNDDKKTSAIAADVVHKPKFRHVNADLICIPYHINKVRYNLFRGPSTLGTSAGFGLYITTFDSPVGNSGEDYYVCEYVGKDVTDKVKSHGYRGAYIGCVDGKHIDGEGYEFKKKPSIAHMANHQSDENKRNASLRMGKNKKLYISLNNVIAAHTTTEIFIDYGNEYEWPSSSPVTCSSACPSLNAPPFRNHSSIWLKKKKEGKLKLLLNLRGRG